MMVVVCLPVAPRLWVKLFAGAGSEWQHNALRYRLMPISCHFLRM